MRPKAFRIQLAAHVGLVIGAILASASQAADGPTPSPLLVGVAVEDITPAPGYPLSGYYDERGAEGTLDPLHAKALYFRQGDVEAALVACDVIGIHRRLTAEIRQRATAQIGLPGEHVILTGTHTHTGPDYDGFLDQYFQSQQSGQPSNDYRVQYIGRLIDKVIKAIADAKTAARPTQPEAGYAQVPGIAFNRRFHMKDGTVRFNPGVGNPDIVRPAGPTDPQVARSCSAA